MPETKIEYGDGELVERIKTFVIPGETLHAVFRCRGIGASIVGITDQRVIFRDQGVLLQKKAMLSIPYNQVIGAAIEDEGSGTLGANELTLITAAGLFAFEFQEAEEALWAYRFIMDQILNQPQPQLRDKAGWG